MAENGRAERSHVLILALASGAAVRDAARQSGFSERTIYRRLKDAKFRQRVKSAQANMLERGVAMLADSCCDSVQTLRKALQSPDDRVKISAARSILMLAGRLHQSVELEERLAALESRLVDYRGIISNDHRPTTDTPRNGHAPATAPR